MLCVAAEESVDQVIWCMLVIPRGNQEVIHIVNIQEGLFSVALVVGDNNSMLTRRQRPRIEKSRKIVLCGETIVLGGGFINGHAVGACPQELGQQPRIH